MSKKFIAICLFLSSSLLAQPNKNQKFLNAVEANNPELVEQLLDKANKREKPDDLTINAALKYAVEKGYSGVAGVLWRQGVSDVPTKNAAFVLAVEKNNNTMVKMFLDNGADANSINTVGMTVLQWAAGAGHSELVQLLLDYGADINFKNSSGFTALSYAVTNNMPATVAMLLDYGADIGNAEDVATDPNVKKLIREVRRKPRRHNRGHGRNDSRITRNQARGSY